MMYRTDLRIKEVVYEFKFLAFFHVTVSNLLFCCVTASFTQLSDPYSGKNVYLFLPSLASLVIFLL